MPGLDSYANSPRMNEGSSSKVIIINGMQRGGTNLLWNLFQSHPQVCSPIYETGEVIYGLRARGKRFRLQGLMALDRIAPGLCRAYLDRRFSAMKMQNFGSADNGEKYQGVPYNRDEVAKSVLCIKSLSRDVRLTEIFYGIYPEAYGVAIVRDGYANCQGWMRRGVSPASFGSLYRQYCEMILAQSERLPNYKILRFEDLVGEFVEQAEMLFHFAGLAPEQLEKYRMKSKRIVGADGAHDAAMGTEGSKYWLTHGELREFLDPDVDQRQAVGLAEADVRALESEAGEVLERFGYREKYRNRSGG